MSYGSDYFRTWIEIDKKALEHNLREFLKLIPKNTKFMAVIKSNAYGHGLVQAAKLLANSQLSITNKQRLWFGVDSVVEGLRLRREGIKNPILVLGATLPSRMREAAKESIILTISNFESLEVLRKLEKRPEVHIKIDTGMHRQGFLPNAVPELFRKLKRYKIAPTGIYTHFASAKDAAYPTYTLEQLSEFKKVVRLFRKVGFKKFIRHAAASGGTILFPETHLDMVRIGMSLYGYFPSPESRLNLYSTHYRGLASIVLKPALSWYTYIVETKKIKRGSYIGYDLTEKVNRDSIIAILPIGYWHGYDRGLSNIGEVLVRGRRAGVLGRVSMDMVVVDVTEISGVKVGDKVTLIGKSRRDVGTPISPAKGKNRASGQKTEELWADELALKIGTTPYEFLTRINPLIRRFAG